MKNQLEYDNLRKYIPYVIEINEENNTYYIMNRDYEYIGLDIKSISKEGDFKRTYLFNDGCPPWKYYRRKYVINVENLIDIIHKYNKLSLDKVCLNMHDNTQTLLNTKK